MRIPSRYLKIAGIILACLLIFSVIAASIAYSKREAILKTVIDKAVTKAKREYNLNLRISDPRFEGLTAIAFSDVSVVPEHRDSLAHFKDIHVGIKLYPLLFGDLKVGNLKIREGRINLVKRDSISNYDFLLRKKTDSTKRKSRADLADLARRMLNQILYKIPDDMSVSNFDIAINHDQDSLRFFTTSATIKNGDLKSNILVNNGESIWHLDGIVNPDDEQLDFKLYAEKKKVELPLIEKKLGLKLNFDTSYVSLKEAKKSGSTFKIYSYCAIKNLLINHPKIAANNIIIPAGSMDANFLIGENYMAIDSSSVIHLKNIAAHPFIKYTRYPHPTYELKVRTDYLDAQQVFNSFPAGLFESLEGMKVAGKLKYALDFFLDTKLPDSVRFNSTLSKQDFKILKWGRTNLSKINEPFVYTPYEYGKPMRDIIIGPQNPDYTPLNQISSYLKNAVLTAEDPSFFTHKGFVEKAFQRSIATNFKEKAFKRGGSTISMQLVKNVFLNRQKTMARKIEEILIVWLIENNRISSKPRMFEVYLNLIEWGNNVYGIGEAARFYFGKTPSQLSLGESLFLANIVPRPKKGLYFFQGDGSLSTRLRGYFKLIGGLMAKKGMIQRDTNAYGFYGVRLKESLRQYSPPDTTALDSLMDEEDPSMDETSDNNFFRRIFGGKKPDSVHVSQLNKLKVIPRDSTQTAAEKRRERREERRRERELKKLNGG